MSAAEQVPLRILGGSGTRVSSLCLGTMMFGDRTDEATAQRIVDPAECQRQARRAQC